MRPMKIVYDGGYDATLGNQLAQVLEFWNHADDAEKTADPNANPDDPFSILSAGGVEPNVNTDANNDPGLTGPSNDIMYSGSLTQVLETLHPTTDWTV